MNQECTDIETIARLTVERDALRATLSKIADDLEVWGPNNMTRDNISVARAHASARAALSTDK